MSGRMVYEPKLGAILRGQFDGLRRQITSGTQISTDALPRYRALIVCRSVDIHPTAMPVDASIHTLSCRISRRNTQDGKWPAFVALPSHYLATHEQQFPLLAHPTMISWRSRPRRRCPRARITRARYTSQSVSQTY